MFLGLGLHEFRTLFAKRTHIILAYLSPIIDNSRVLIVNWAHSSSSATLAFGSAVWRRKVATHANSARGDSAPVTKCAGQERPVRCAHTRFTITLDSWYCGVFRVRVFQFQGLMCKMYSYFSILLADNQGFVGSDRGVGSSRGTRRATTVTSACRRLRLCHRVQHKHKAQ